MEFGEKSGGRWWGSCCEIEKEKEKEKLKDSCFDGM